MIIAMVAVSAVVVGTCVCVAIREFVGRRTPRELRGDWWTSFEREFRAYTMRLPQHRPVRRPPGPANRP